MEIYLSLVEQSPSKVIQKVLEPTLKALVSNEFVRHSDVDVRVAVAACLSEITRITAPEVPYNDDQMKVVFICLCDWIFYLISLFVLLFLASTVLY